MTADDRVATDRARFAAWAQQAREHGESPATPAATVVVLREGPDGPETLMLRKNSRIAFGGMWVFPGGKVDDEDWEEAADDVDAARTAAVREAEEEARLRVEPDEMVLFAHWLPPSIAPKRYATWFFAAPVEDDDVIIDAGEIVDMGWWTPEEVLRRHHEGDIELVPPTWITLDSIAGHDSVAAVLEHLAARPARHYATTVARGAEPPVVMWEGDAGWETADAGAPGSRHRLTMAPEGYVYDDSGAPE